MKKILTGIQPTGEITLGNYVGAINQVLKYQDIYESYIFVADMHAITVEQEPEKLRKNIRNLLNLYLACGIDPKKNKIFIQSENEYHCNISWILECNTPYGELSRMTQFKDKSQKKESFSAGLLTYPILMAADILTYDVDFVPVGIDQKQHVELARNIAERFNKRYGNTFKIPEPLISKEGTKIMDLQVPTKKMSKSSESKKGTIGLLDDIDSIRKKIMSATTDSEMIIRFDPVNKPGISNLMNIYSSLTGTSLSDIEKKFCNSNYGEFKKSVADVVVNLVSDIQKRYNEFESNFELDKILDSGREDMIKISKNKFELMKNKIGLGR